jgi:hypothetical protein
MLTRLEDGTKTQLNWLPAVAWNAHDALLAGLVLHNSVLPLRNWEWMAMPLWSASRSELAGIGRASFKMGNGRFEAQIRKFAQEGIANVYDIDYFRSSLQYMHRFNANPGIPLRSKLSVSLIDVRERSKGLGIDPGFAPNPTTNRQAVRLNYTIDRERGNLQQNGELRITAAGSEVWLGGAYGGCNSFFRGLLLPELNARSLTVETIWEGRKEVNRRGLGWDWRVYAAHSFGSVWVYPLMNAGIAGNTDMFKDHAFLGRGRDGLLSRIIAREQGGLSIMDVPYSSNADAFQTRLDQMLSARVSRDLTKRLSLYGGGLIGREMDLFTAGLEVKVLFLKVQLPVIQRLNGFSTLNFKGATTFSVVMNLEKLSPYQLLRRGDLIN